MHSSLLMIIMCGICISTVTTSILVLGESPHTCGSTVYLANPHRAAATHNLSAFENEHTMSPKNKCITYALDSMGKVLRLELLTSSNVADVSTQQSHTRCEMCRDVFVSH